MLNPIGICNDKYQLFNDTYQLINDTYQLINYTYQLVMLYNIIKCYTQGITTLSIDTHINWGGAAEISLTPTLACCSSADRSAGVWKRSELAANAGKCKVKLLSGAKNRRQRRR